MWRFIGDNTLAVMSEGSFCVGYVCYMSDLFLTRSAGYGTMQRHGMNLHSGSGLNYQYMVFRFEMETILSEINKPPFS